MEENNFQLIINPALKDILRKADIFEQDGIMLLIATYFGLSPSYLKDETNYYHQIWNKILTLNIFTVDYSTDTLEWKIPVFGTETLVTFDDEWVKTFMNKFKEVNPERRGDKSAVIKNLKRLIREYPLLTKEKIIEVTDYYFSTLSSAQFCKKSHKFLYDINGSVFIETLESLNNSYTENYNII